MATFGPSEVALHRYFLWANRLRSHAQACGEAPTDGIARRLWFNQAFAYVGLWLGLLFVVLEGWRELGHQDAAVAELLEPDRVELLRRFRNGAFHFQKEYFDDRFSDVFSRGTDALLWAGKLHDAIGNWFLHEAELAGVDVASLRMMAKEALE